jgi:5-methyltetrahydrofolate--homocysteine methyltransferase
VKLTESYAMWLPVGIGALFQPSRKFHFMSARSSATRSKTTPRAKLSVAEAERWLAPVLTTFRQDQSAQDRRLKSDAEAGAVIGVPANDVAPEEIASHPPGCNCAVHLASPQEGGGRVDLAAHPRHHRA